MEQVSATGLDKIRNLPTKTKVIFSIKLILIILVFGFIYYPVFIWMWQRWFAADSYYSHGPLIPIVSIVLIWTKRSKLLETRIASSNLGLAILLAGVFLHIVSSSLRIYFSSAFSFLLVLFGLILFLLGKDFNRVIIFPLCFLIFMVPAPLALVASSALRLKLFAANASVYIIQLFGVSALREGSMVYMDNTSALVGDPCSGLRSLISLPALSILYTYIVRASYTRKAILFLISIPLAIFANIVRTTTTLLIANSYGNAILTNNFLHKGLGLLVFVIAFIGLFLAGRLLKCQVPQRDF